MKTKMTTGKAYLAAVALTAIIAIFKANNWVHVSWVWVASPFWIPFAEAILVWVANLVDKD
jgi:hypothetical protein